MRLPGSTDLTGRAGVVTGASSGIGLEAARGLAMMGATVVLACRDERRGEAARASILESVPSAALELTLVDLSRQASVRSWADALLQRHAALHFLVNNAGCWSSRHRTTDEGLELTWATNLLGHFLATQRLLPALRAGAPSRIVNVASELARDLDLHDVGFERRAYDGLTAYAQSKQAQRQWTWALARRLEGSGVAANALRPGFVATGIFRKGGGWRGLLADAYARLRGRSASAAAEAILWLVASPELEGRSGRYFFDREERPCRYRDPAGEERLWALCERQTSPVPAPSRVHPPERVH